MEKCCLCDNPASYFIPMFDYLNNCFDETATIPYYYCQSCHDGYPVLTHSGFIKMTAFDWSADKELV